VTSILPRIGKRIRPGTKTYIRDHQNSEAEIVKMKPEAFSCPVCRSQITTLYYCKNRTIPVKSFNPSSTDFGIYYDLYRCEECHAVFASEIPSEEAIAEVYQASCHDGYLLEETNRRHNFLGLIRMIAIYQDTGQPLKLLDVGASTGLFLDTVRSLYPNWILLGVEASLSAIGQARQLYNIKLKQGMFELVEIPPASQDIITMLDFIEHVRDPRENIKLAKRYLKPGGILVITTPNINSWTSRIFRSRWWGFRLMHTLYFSRLSMTQMMAQEGFQVIKMRGLIRFFSLRYCLRHLGWTIQGPSIQIPFPLSLGDMLVVARKEVSMN